jgi:hypothetical protein
MTKMVKLPKGVKICKGRKVFKDECPEDIYESVKDSLPSDKKPEKESKGKK